MVQAIRVAKKALGHVSYEATEKEKASRMFRRSIFVVKEVPAGAEITAKNVRIICLGHGLAPKHLANALGRKAKKALRRGAPLKWENLT